MTDIANLPSSKNGYEDCKESTAKNLPETKKAKVISNSSVAVEKESKNGKKSTKASVKSKNKKVSLIQGQKTITSFFKK